MFRAPTSASSGAWARASGPSLTPAPSPATEVGSWPSPIERRAAFKSCTSTTPKEVRVRKPNPKSDPPPAIASSPRGRHLHSPRRGKRHEPVGDRRARGRSLRLRDTRRGGRLPHGKYAHLRRLPLDARQPGARLFHGRYVRVRRPERSVRVSAAQRSQRPLLDLP